MNLYVQIPIISTIQTFVLRNLRKCLPIGFFEFIQVDFREIGPSVDIFPLLNIFKYAWNGIIQFLSFALKMVGNGIGAFTRIFNKDLGDAITKSTEYTANKFSDSFKFAFKEVQKESKKGSKY